MQYMLEQIWVKMLNFPMLDIIFVHYCIKVNGQKSCLYIHSLATLLGRPQLLVNANI